MPPVVDEVAQGIGTELAEAADVLRWIRFLVVVLLRVALEDVLRLLLRQDDRVEALAQAALADVGVVQRRVGQFVLVEDPAHPALVDRRPPRLVDADARQRRRSGR